MGGQVWMPFGNRVTVLIKSELRGPATHACHLRLAHLEVLYLQPCLQVSWSAVINTLWLAFTNRVSIACVSIACVSIACVHTVDADTSSVHLCNMVAALSAWRGARRPPKGKTHWHAL